jgi:hypothetical protein
VASKTTESGVRNAEGAPVPGVVCLLSHHELPGLAVTGLPEPAGIPNIPTDGLEHLKHARWITHEFCLKVVNPYSAHVPAARIQWFRMVTGTLSLSFEKDGVHSTAIKEGRPQTCLQ